MERDTRHLALISVGLGIAIVTLLPVDAGLAVGFRPGMFATLGPTFVGNIQVTDAYDLIQNILLYLPLGFFAAVSGTEGGSVSPTPREREHPAQRLMWAGLAGLLLSAMLEGLQLWIPGRYCSLSDVITNGLGAWLGGLATRMATATDQG